MQKEGEEREERDDIRRTKLDGKHIVPLRGSPLRGSSPNWHGRLTLNYTMDRVETDEMRDGQIPWPMINRIRRDFDYSPLRYRSRYRSN